MRRPGGGKGERFGGKIRGRDGRGDRFIVLAPFDRADIDRHVPQEDRDAGVAFEVPRLHAREFAVESDAGDGVTERFDLDAGVDQKNEIETRRPLEERVHADPSFGFRDFEISVEGDFPAELHRVRGDREINFGLDLEPGDGRRNFQGQSIQSRQLGRRRELREKAADR